MFGSFSKGPLSLVGLNWGGPILGSVFFWVGGGQGAGAFQAG